MSTVSWLQFLGGLGLGLSLSYIMSQFQQKVSEKEEESDKIDDSDEWEDETDSDGGTLIIKAENTEVSEKSRILIPLTYGIVPLFNYAKRTKIRWSYR